MSTGIALDLNLDDSAWLATLDALLVDVKVDKRSGHTEDDARFKAIAAWANLIDDFVIACKMALRLLYRGNGSPEGVVAAPVGALYQRRDGGPGTTLYTKETGTGNTGWAPVGGAAAPADAQYIVAVASGSLSAERVLTTTDTINVDSSAPGLTTLTTLLFTEQSDGGGITEELNYLEVDQTSGLALANVGARHARLSAVPATIVVEGGGRLVLSRNTTLVDVDNTTTETDLVNYTIPANTLDANGVWVVIEQCFDHLNNGATRSITLRWYVGGVLVHEGTPISFGSNATRHPLAFTTRIVSLGATQQSVWVTGLRAGSATPPATGQGGQLGTAGTPFVLWGADSAADRTNTIAVRITIAHSAATSNQRTRQPFYLVERV